jgi:hypothetical protein
MWSPFRSAFPAPTDPPSRPELRVGDAARRAGGGASERSCALDPAANAPESGKGEFPALSDRDEPELEEERLLFPDDPARSKKRPIVTFML